MSSILTNMSAMSAVASLTATQKALATTQNQISTGLKVADASDNAAYWSIATTMRSDVGALGAVGDSLNLGSSVIGVATSALSQSIDILNKMKDDVVSATQSGVDSSKVQIDISSLQGQLRSFANSATFNGVNLLASTGAGTATIVTSFQRNATGIQVGTTDIGGASTLLYSTVASQGTAAGSTAGILDKVDTTTSYTGSDGVAQTGGVNESIDTLDVTSKTTDQLGQMAQFIDNTIAALTTAASNLGSTQSNITAQSTFVTSLSDSITTGVGSLVDADMNETSTRLNALQTQQQLGIQSLSIANQNSQLILKLFQ